jgi:aspartyl/asparaginyl-tRNA synthetase
LNRIAGRQLPAENPNTSLHLGEFRMIEREIAFTDLADNASLAEKLRNTSSRRY